VAALAKGTATFAKKNKTLTGGYLIGLLCLLFATGFKVNETSRQAYERTMDKVDTESLARAHRRYRDAEASYQASMGWFWSCDTRCQHWKATAQSARAELDALQREEQNIVGQAKHQVGIFSEYGVQETRDVWWSTFSGGQDFAKRQSMWDLLFTGLRWDRDEQLFSVVIRWLIQLLFNFTIGMVMAFCVFVFRLWSVVSSYQPDPATALAFYTVALLAASACVITYLACLYGAAAGSVAVVAKAIVDHNHRLNSDPRYRAQRVQYQYPPRGTQRPHYS